METYKKLLARERSQESFNSYLLFPSCHAYFNLRTTVGPWILSQFSANNLHFSLPLPIMTLGTRKPQYSQSSQPMFFPHFFLNDSLPILIYFLCLWPVSVENDPSTHTHRGQTSILKLADSLKILVLLKLKLGKINR